MQVMLIGGILALMAYSLAQLMTTSNRDSMRMIHRHENISTSLDFAALVNSREAIRNAASVLGEDTAGNPIQYP